MIIVTSSGPIERVTAMVVYSRVKRNVRAMLNKTTLTMMVVPVSVSGIAKLETSPGGGGLNGISENSKPEKLSEADMVRRQSNASLQYKERQG